jgi:hypothetical protein
MLKIPKEQSKVANRRTYITMANITSTKDQIMTYKTLHRKLKIDMSNTNPTKYRG